MSEITEALDALGICPLIRASKIGFEVTNGAPFPTPDAALDAYVCADFDRTIAGLRTSIDEQTAEYQRLSAAWAKYKAARGVK